MDKLTLKNLKYHARHGYYDEEREKGNEFEVDLVFGLDLYTIGKLDDLSRTVDYEEAEQVVSDIMNGESVRLIETLARRIGDRLFEEYDILKSLRVRVRKLNPPLVTETDYSEVSMTWQR